ncbi:haloacid dehalogenase-like hydrolase domain-containing protein 2 [Liolophura sinensis]|uniref:haloacid dehalogenase-like hydrolase domain-containing protein 2 n=1 Tax=Liolophura sinensis TaxID=3198878 RepID=UPI0031580C96
MSSKIEAALVDLSGTLHVEDAVVPGSVKALQRLRKSEIKIKFVTNTTKECKQHLVERLHGLGFDIKPEEIFTSLTAARCLVEHRKLQPMLLLEDTAKEDFVGVAQDTPNAVVVGLAPSQFNYSQMNKAFRLLLTGAPLIGIHKARYYRRSDGLALGPGPFVAGLEYAAGVTAEVVGKPEASFFTSALDELGVSIDKAVMIGDDARDDIEGAQKIGIRGILVQTGKYREGDESKIKDKPYCTCANFSKAVDFILECV